MDLGIDSLSKFQAIGKEGTILRATPTSSKISHGPAGFAVSHASHVYRDKVKKEALSSPTFSLIRDIGLDARAARLIRNPMQTSTDREIERQLRPFPTPF